MGGGEEDPLCLSKPILSELESVLRGTANTGPTLGGDTPEPREVGSGGRDYLVICSGTGEQPARVGAAASRGEERQPDPGGEAPSPFPSPRSFPSSLH